MPRNRNDSERYELTEGEKRALIKLIEGMEAINAFLGKWLPLPAFGRKLLRFMPSPPSKLGIRHSQRRGGIAPGNGRGYDV